MDTKTRSPAERAARVSEFVADRIRVSEQERTDFAERNWVEPGEPLDVVELLGLDPSQLEAWREEARKGHIAHVESVKSRLKNFGVGSVPKRTSLFPLDVRPDKASLPICLSKPDSIEFSPGVNGVGDLATASMQFEYSSTGVGGHFGVEATPVTEPHTASFWYGLDPPAGGTLVVLGALRAKGFLSTHEYSSSPLLRFLAGQGLVGRALRARAWVGMYLRVHQPAPFFVQTVRVPIERVEEPPGLFLGTGRFFTGQVFSAVLSAQIAPDKPVAIEMGVEFDAEGRSDFCGADVSFTNPGVVAEALCLNLLPADIIL